MVKARLTDSILSWGFLMSTRKHWLTAPYLRALICDHRGTGEYILKLKQNHVMQRGMLKNIFKPECIFILYEHSLSSSDHDEP